MEQGMNWLDESVGEDRCWRQGNRKIYDAGGEFVISDCGCWLPGNYDSLDAAKMAFDFDDEMLAKLMESVNPITLDALKG
jgi:hypothetical protein